MITMALIPKVHHALDCYIDLYGNTDDQVDRLTPKDWLKLKQVINSYLNYYGFKCN